jgi:hypothetical protein
MGSETNDPQVARAEEFVFEIIRRDMERQGEGEAVLYLGHLLSARAESVQPQGPFRRIRFKMYQRTSDYSLQLNAVTGEQTGWYFSALAVDPGNEVTAEKALQMATRAAQPPEGAVLEHSGYEDQGEEPVFVARWKHVEKGLPVERDFIHAMVNGATGRTFAVQRCWHAVDPNARWC